MNPDEPSQIDTTEKLNRELLRQAYRTEPDTVINQWAQDAVRRREAGTPGGLQPAVTSAPARRRPAIRRMVGRAGIAAAVVAAVALIVVLEGERITAALAEESGLFTVAVIFVLALAILGWMRVRERYEKVLSCRVRIDSRFDVGRFDFGERLNLTDPNANAVEDPGMVAVRVKNLSGATIQPEDYIEPLLVRFPGRRMRTVEVTESDPPELQNLVSTHADFRAREDSITLPPVRLMPDDSYYVLVVVSGTKEGQHYEVPVTGQLRGGWITSDANIPWIRRRTIVAGAVTTLAAGVLVVALLLNIVQPFPTIPAGLRCVPGSLTVEGSSAFGLAATRAASEYQTFCPDSTIDVRTPGSVEGLRRLHDAPESERSSRLAPSDGKETQGFSELEPHPVAIVPLTVVANDQVPVGGLTGDQARNIFTGAVTDWGEITSRPGDDQNKVRVVVRADNSGTRLTLQQHVLPVGPEPREQADPTSDTCEELRQGVPADRAIVCERGTTSDVLNRTAAVDYAIGYADLGDVIRTPGVKPLSLDGRRADLAGIRAGYPFWTVEYIYSYGPTAPGSLAQSFIDYLTSYLLRAQDEARDAGRQPDYFPCGAVDVRALCERGDR